MSNIIQRDKQNEWIRPWNIVKFDDLYNRDDRFFSILIRGLLNWLTRNIIMYNKPIKHYIKDTGSSYMYIESNGYEYKVNTVTGEDWMYNEMPRCLVDIEGISIPFEELTNPYSRGVYERTDGNNIRGFNAQIRRMPVEMSVTLHYVLSNYNESLILIQELIDKVCFQQYFTIVYLGQIINRSFEVPADFNIQFNKIDMTSTETNQKQIDLTLKVCSNYPCIDERTETSNDLVLSNFEFNSDLYKGGDTKNSTDKEDRNF